MQFLVGVVGAAGLIVALSIVLKGRRALRDTSLGQAWCWAMGGLILWLATWSAQALDIVSQPGMLDHLWYLVANVMLCSLIGVLGARRPTVHVWGWFILAPLLVVLEWPALIELNFDGVFDRLHLSIPPLVGYGLVLLMGVGNYAGTRFAIPAVLLAAALLMIVVPMSAASPFSSDATEWLRAAATLTVVLSCACLYAIAKRQPTGPTRLDTLWTRFRDMYGIVWARRLEERMNEAAHKEGWPVMLKKDGFAWTEPTDEMSRAELESQLEQRLRWLLRRFVDSDWIERQLPPDAPG